MESQDAKDVFWTTLGDKVSQIVADWRNLHLHVFFPSFGATHVIAKHFYKLEPQHLQSDLDSIVSNDYPREVHSIGDQSITSVFYHGGDMAEFVPILRYKVTNPRMKHIYEEDMVFIQEFLTRYEELLTEITTSNYLNALPRGPQMVYFQEVKRTATKLRRYIGEMRTMFQQAGFMAPPQ